MNKLAIFYGRCSAIDDESVDSQRLVCTEHAPAMGYTIPADPGYHYADDNVSGAVRRRRGLDALLQDVQSGLVGPNGKKLQVSGLVLRDQARLWRGLDPRFPAFFEYLLAQYGIQVYYTDATHHPDYSGELGDVEVAAFISRAVDTVMAARERLRLRNKFRNKKRELVKQRFYPTGAVPYGLERILIDKETRAVVRVIQPGERVKIDGCRGFLRIGDPEHAEIVRQIYRDIQGGKSLRSIAERLNERGIPSPGGSKWIFTEIADIARNPLNCGDLIWGRYRRTGTGKGKDLPAPVPHTEAKETGTEPILYRDFLDEKIVSRELWEEVQQILEGIRTLWSKRRTCRPRYLLTGKVLCTACGCLMQGTHKRLGQRSIRYRHPPGYLDRYRSCPGFRKTIRGSLVEDAVLNKIREVLLDGDVAERVRGVVEERQEDGDARASARARAALEKSITRLAKELDRAVAAQLNASGSHREKLDAAAVRIGQQLDSKKAEVHALDEASARLRSLGDTTYDFLEPPELLLTWLDGSQEDRRRVVEAVVHSIRYDGASSEITLLIRLRPETTNG